MQFTKFLFKFAAISVLVLGAALAVFADTVKLKDGSVIKGKIISFSGGKFVMLIGQGERQREMTFYADEIESIAFDGSGAEILSLPSAGTEQTPTPAYTEKVEGNETIITVGGTRNDGVRREPPRLKDQPVIDPNAVAVDPYEDSTIPSSDVGGNSDVIIEDDPADQGSIEEDPVDDQPSLPIEDPTKPRPVQLKVTVLADDTANGWTNAGFVVRKGQRIKVISNGRISLGNGRTSGPNGLTTLPDENKLIKDRPTGSLIAVIGDDNNDFIFLGEDREFVAARDGALFLGVNEGNLYDNSGSFDVIVEIFAEGN